MPQIQTVSPDFYSIEGRTRVIEAIWKFQETSEHIFRKLTFKIDNISQRISKSQDQHRKIENQIDMLLQTDINFSLKILSNSRYPKNIEKVIDNPSSQQQGISKFNSHYPSIISYQDKGIKIDREIQQNYKELIETEIKFCQDMNVFEGQEGIQNQKLEGFGKQPTQITYVTSLLIANTKFNPYQKTMPATKIEKEYQFQSVIQKRQSIEKKSINIDRPRSFYQKENKRDMLDLNYKPAKKEERGLRVSKNLQILNIVQEEENEITSFQPLQQDRIQQDNHSQEKVDIIKETQNVQIQEYEVKGNIPLPPPLMLPKIIPKILAQETPKLQEQVSLKEASSENNRNDMLRQIREIRDAKDFLKARKGKVEQVKEIKRESLPQKKEEFSLMDQLKQKITQRHMQLNPKIQPAFKSNQTVEIGESDEWDKSDQIIYKVNQWRNQVQGL